MYKKDKFDITICYKKVFDMLSTTCNVQGVVEMVSDYADVSIVVVDIGGNVIATSLHTANQDMTDETFGKLISACVEQREYGESSLCCCKWN
jgi:GTP-sensing pleiotropic transcriptional regulator CodY